MQAMDVALAFGCADVDAFLASITHEQFLTWCDYFSIRPQGWEADRMLAGYIACSQAQTQTRKRLKMSDFVPRLGAETVQSDAVMRARFEARAIRASMEEGN